METITFDVPGLPRPAGSKKGFPIKRANGTTGVVITDSSGKAGKDWRTSVSHAAAEAMRGREIIRGPVVLTAVFTMPRPKAHYRTGKRAHEMRDDAPHWHTKKPDRTKLLRAVEDAMSGIVWADDNQVIDGVTRKVYGEPIGVSVTVEAVSDDYRPEDLA